MAIQTFLTPKYYNPQLIQYGTVTLTKAAAASSASAAVALSSGRNAFAIVFVKISNSFYPLEHVIHNTTTGVVDAELWFGIDDQNLTITYDPVSSSLIAEAKTYEFTYQVYDLKLIT